MAESLESRTLLSVNIIKPLAGYYPVPIKPYVPPTAHLNIAFPTKVTPSAAFAMAAVAAPLASTPVGRGYTPSQMRTAYGLNQVMFGNVVGDGSGQTIAIIDAYDYANAFTDLQAFDTAFGIPNPPSFTRVSETGSTTALPPSDPNGPGFSSGTWELEEALDIEWSHAIAPQANIILVEASSASFSDLITSAAGWAKAQAGVSVISMSFGSNEFLSETGYDSTFTTPSGHNPVTFVASTGDVGAPGEYPAFSPNVVAVGGTSLSIDANGNYISESGWSSGGGGISSYEAKPSYQSTVTLSTNRRTSPDLSLDADPNTGVPIYDSFDYPSSPWIQIGGTSLAAPMFAGMVAIADQGRTIAGLPTLSSSADTLPAIYSIPAADYHDVTSGNNGNSTGAGVGYDLITGRGTPVANLFINDVAGVGSIAGQSYEDRNGDGVFDAGDVPLGGTTLFIDANNNGILDPGGTVTSPTTSVGAPIPDNSTTGATSTIPITLGGLITDINVTLKITHNRDSDLKAVLIGPDGTQITLFSGVGGSGHNFTNTTFDDSATTLISSGIAPFSGTYRPSTPLSTFNGKLATGSWKLKVTDMHSGTTGQLVSWSITVTTGPEKSVTTAADGTYLWNLPDGAVNLRETLPSGYTASGAANYSLALSGNMTAENFGFFPTTFSAPDLNDTYYLWLLPATTSAPAQVQIGTSPGTAIYSIAASLLPSLAFNLLGNNSKLIIDFTNGSPLPAGNLTLTGSASSNSELDIIGVPTGPSFTMTDTQIGPTGGPFVTYQNLTSLTLDSATVNFSGTLANLQNLTINSGTAFYWD